MGPRRSTSSRSSCCDCRRASDWRSPHAASVPLAVRAPPRRGPPAGARCPGPGARCLGRSGDGGCHRCASTPEEVDGRPDPDGGVAGGHLPRVALAWGRPSAHERPADELRGTEASIADYMRSELLEPLDPESQRWLLRSSVLDAMSGPLCDAALETTGSLARLRQLERHNLFVIALDCASRHLPLSPPVPRLAAGRARGPRAGRSRGGVRARGRLVRRARRA